MPQKEGGFAQALFQASATKMEMLGRLRRDGDRWYAYAKAGATALTAGQLTTVTPPVSGHEAMVCVAASKGDYNVTVTPLTANVTANQYKDGYLHIDNGAGIGNAYRIDYHAAITLSVAGVVYLIEPIRTALTTASTATFNYNNQDGVVVLPAATATATGAIAGVPPRDVPANYYFWNQIKGPAPISCDSNTTGVLVKGNIVIADWTATSGSLGSVIPIAATSSIADVIKGGFIGTVLRVNAAGTAAMINLNLLGY
jgi:hypothetical protein